MSDEIQISIEPDGTVVVTTDAISPGNHMSADALVKYLAQIMGGEVRKQKRPQTQTTQRHTLHQ